MANSRRTFTVCYSQDIKSNKIESYFVTDAVDNDEINQRPVVVRFPISESHDEFLQERRASDYCNYLNMLATAAEEAYEHNKLVNILKA